MGSFSWNTKKECPIGQVPKMVGKELTHTIAPFVLITKLTGTQHVNLDPKTLKPTDIGPKQKVYNFFVALILLSVSIWSLRGKIMYAYEYQLPLVKTLNILFQMSLTFGLFFQSIYPLCTSYKLATFFVNIMEITRALQYQHNRLMRYITIGLLILFHMFALIFILFDMGVWKASFGINIAMYYICDSIMLYKLTIYSLKLFILLTLLRERFRYINKLLPLSAHNKYYEITSMLTRTMKSYEMKGTITPDMNVTKLKKPPTVRELSRIHETLYQSCNEINKFFNPLIVTLCFEVFVMMTQSVYCGVVFGTGMQKTLNPNFRPLLAVGVMICWTVYSFILVVMLTSLCGYTVKEANDAAIIAHRLLLDDGLNEQTITELTRFAAKIQQQNLRFTAACLFGINLTTLLQLLGAVSSYIIVAFQFEGLSPAQVITDQLLVVKNAVNNSSNFD